MFNVIIENLLTLKAESKANEEKEIAEATDAIRLKYKLVNDKIDVALENFGYVAPVEEPAVEEAITPTTAEVVDNAFCN